jgi:hypothetical protein
MNARQRINQYYATLAIVLATFIGLVANSWIVFAIAAPVLLALQLIGGVIRIGGSSRRTRRRRRRRFHRHAHDDS